MFYWFNGSSVYVSYDVASVDFVVDCFLKFISMYAAILRCM